jgi:predicted DNA-binding transcriptional regulator YafY
MANTSSRTLRLLSLLQNHRYWPGPELAERLGVSLRTLRRDVDRLRELGYPVEAHRGVDGGYQLAAGAALPPLVVDDEEAVALAVGLRLAAQGTFRPDGVAEASARALAKVTQVMPPRLRRQVEAVATMTESATWETVQASTASAFDPEVLSRAALACRDAERIRFGYVAANGEQSRRHVEPHRLVALDRRWYLVGYDLDRQDWRSFRLDRVAAVPAGKAVSAGKAVPAGKIVPAGKAALVQPTGARFRPRQIPGGDAAAFVRAGASARPAGPEVVAIVEAPAAAVRERIGPWSSIEEVGPGRCRVTMTPREDSYWAVIALGVLGADFQVISPPEVADRVREWGARFTRATSAGEPPGPASP